MSQPIDPRDGEALRVVMWKASNNHARDIESFTNDWEGSPPEAELHLLQVIADEAAATAVARAVYPGHHAVYDTRTHVAVPVETLVKLSDSVSALKHVTSGVAMRNNVRVITCRIDALIPTEATDES